MEIVVHIDEPFAANLTPKPLKQAVTTTLHFGSKPGSNDLKTISVVITDNETVQQLNRQYRGVDAPTDVLSFAPVPDPDFPLDEEAATHLGDVIIAYPIAETQAQAAGHATLEEVMLLTVHGALHLLGFDHHTPRDKREMWAMQQQIMVELGLAHVQPTET
ncbi:MAG: rRNA maturation RNase YbeY [Anaerolineae bacterium]|nr:rRNA maturation RNase YbeY [Anaerolineae bacterium]